MQIHSINQNQQNFEGLLVFKNARKNLHGVAQNSVIDKLALPSNRISFKTIYEEGFNPLKSMTEAAQRKEAATNGPACYKTIVEYNGTDYYVKPSFDKVVDAYQMVAGLPEKIIEVME